MKNRLLGIVSACLLAGAVQADSPVQVQDSAPERYTVVSGDTLWGISNRFLKDAWRWPEVWEANKQIYNPHLIYPGDVLLLCRIKGVPVLAVDQGGGCAEVTARIASGGGVPTQTKLADGTVKLHPQARVGELSVAVPSIPLKEIQRYLNDSRVVTQEELDRAPYVIGGAEGHVILGANDNAYVRNKNNQLEVNSTYGVYRGGKSYIDPDTNQVLGFEAEDIGTGELAALDKQVGTLHLRRTTKNVSVGDKLLASERAQVTPVFYPSNPDGVKPGRIVRVFGSIGSASEFSVIVINRGAKDGAKAGHTFAIYHRGGQMQDTIGKDIVSLPDERAGLAMVFRTFDRVSYALVLRSNMVIKVGDHLRAPISGD